MKGGRLRPEAGMIQPSEQLRREEGSTGWGEVELATNTPGILAFYQVRRGPGESAGKPRHGRGRLSPWRSLA